MFNLKIKLILIIITNVFVCLFDINNDKYLKKKKYFYY